MEAALLTFSMRATAVDESEGLMEAKDAEEAIGSMYRTWNRDRKGGSKGYPGNGAVVGWEGDE